MLAAVPATPPAGGALPLPGSAGRQHHFSGLLSPCCTGEGCPLNTNSAQYASLGPNTAPFLLQTGSAAKWRRKAGSVDIGTANAQREQQEKIFRERAASYSDLKLRVHVMEQVHGVDVSWLHRPNKDQRKYVTSPDSTTDVRKDIKAPSSASPSAPPPAPPSAHPQEPKRKAPAPPTLAHTTGNNTPSFPNVTPPTPVEPTKDTTHAYSSTAPSPHKSTEAAKRPGVFHRNSSEKVPQEGNAKPSKRTSWMSNISSKLSSSQSSLGRPSPTPAQPQKQQQPSTPPTPSGAQNGTALEVSEPYTPSKTKESSSSFFSSLKRSLSATSQTGGIPKAQGTGSVCPRRVLNVDPNRERCDVPEMDNARLRKVAFNVDVEIAGGPRYTEYEDEEDRQRKKKEFKMKERAEGEALKNPEAMKDEKDENEQESQSKGISAGSEVSGESPTVDGTEEDRAAAARKRDKKKQSEAERKERKEKRRKRAEESGAIPVEVSLDEDATDATIGAWPTRTSSLSPTSQPNGTSSQVRPTTDPVRIYRRCCQLRESPILKRITEQLSNPKSLIPQEPGVVNTLDLTGSRLQLADVVSLGDWLAIVPVKHLKLEDADLSDEGVRCILAGLLAAKRPEPPRRKSSGPKHRQGIKVDRHQERSGVIEKITLKNNPRMTRAGWKHVSLFIYMCRSLKTIDVSMNFFPETLPPSAHSTPLKGSANGASGQAGDLDAAEVLLQCLSKRLGGDNLDELIMSECGLSSPQVSKIVDGVIAAGVNRLGLAGNSLDDEGLDYVEQFLRSDVCQAVDIGGNDLRGKLGSISDAITYNINPNIPYWGLGLADCNLDSASLKPLFPALSKLPSFRFLDLSHNPQICAEDNGLCVLLRRFVSTLPDLKRIHLADVGMSPKQAIALADILPEGPMLAHVSLLENPQLTALANAKTESDQEEACALYASLMAAVRVSDTLMCIDIDVPSTENSEVVQALAKQVVAYSLRNMEKFALTEASGEQAANASAALTGSQGGKQQVKDITVPDVLMHLVGHVEGNSENHDNDDPAPDEDYIVGGTGVVKALQYVLGEKSDENKRLSMPTTPTGNLTPSQRPSSAQGTVEQGKAKMSKNLLQSARNIRARLQPALVKELNQGQDEAAYRRLLFLDTTLQNIIERFEEEYPDCRVAPQPAPKDNDTASTRSSITDKSNIASSFNTQPTEPSIAGSEEDEMVSAEEDNVPPARNMSRQNSVTSLASRAQTMEEGRLHRMGQAMRREVIDSPAKAEFSDVPWRRDAQDAQDERLRKFGDQLENLSGVDLKTVIDEEGWDNVMTAMGGSYEDLRHLQEQDPEAWEMFKQAQETAWLNLKQQQHS